MSSSSSAFAAGQRLLLERIAYGAPLPELLTDLVHLVEHQVDGMLGSILLVDGERGTIHPIAGPSLPVTYTSALEGAKIGPCAGSCGTAAYLKERVVVPDIATHPYWVDYKELALSHGLRACWSTPILTADHAVLGTFAMYYAEPREPIPIELEWVDAATHIATIAILRDRSEHELRDSERRFRALAVDLDERIKQLTLLHTIARLIESEIAIDQALLNAIVAIVPSGFRRSALSEAHLSYGELDAATEAFGEVDQRLTEVFEVGGRKGVLEIGYRRGTVSGPSEDAFLIGERQLVRSITDMLVSSFGRDHAIRALREAERLKSLGTLAAGIAHDFNNILTAVRGHTEIALLDAQGSTVARQSLEEVRSACSRATKLVRQILTFGQREATRRETVSLRAVVDEAVGLIASTLPPAIDLRTHFAPGECPIWADETQVHQVLMNVTGNAIHAMGERVGAIEIALDNLEVGETQRHLDLANGRYTRLRIKDAGCGMTPETLARAFDPFFTTKPQGQGTGLGLSVVHGIMKSHDGTVTVDSEIGRGTTFDLYFPAAKAAMPPVVRPEHVMYVDDDETLVALTLRMLRKLGYRATGLVDANEALALLRGDPRAVDLVISDTNMPGCSGPDFVREVRALYPHVRAVLVSGFVDDDPDEAGREAITLKPRTAEELEQIVRRALPRTSLPKGARRPA